MKAGIENRTSGKMTFRTALAAVGLSAGLMLSAPAFATVVQTIGAGSAVTTVNASADFETTNALNDNPFTEGGMEFSRTNLSFNNNGCGYSGCTYHSGFFPGFSGNYMYGVGNGFFEMATTGSDLFFGLEFLAGTGTSFAVANPFSWEAFKNGSSVGSGTFSLNSVSVVGFADANGFDTLRFTDSHAAPAFDSVRAQLSAAQPPSSGVPAPASLALLGLGLLALGYQRRPQKRSA